MQYNKGDLIIKNGEVFFARMVDDEGTTLFHRLRVFSLEENYGRLLNRPMEEGTGSFLMRINDDCEHYSFNKENGKMQADHAGHFPVIGTYDRNTGKLYLDLASIAKYYPEMAVNYSSAIAKYCERSTTVQNIASDLSGPPALYPKSEPGMYPEGPISHHKFPVSADAIAQKADPNPQRKAPRKRINKARPTPRKKAAKKAAPKRKRN